MKKEFNITEWLLKTKLKESSETNEYPPYMYSPVGFGCHVCKYHEVKWENKVEGKHICTNSYYQDYIKSKFPELQDPSELVDNNGNPIKDPSKWCSNWFKPKGE